MLAKAKNAAKLAMRAARPRIRGKIMTIVACGLLACSAAGCVDKEYRGLNAVGGGYVVNVDPSGRILVVSPENERVSGNDDYYSAIWYALPEKQEPIGVGREVNVWTEEGAVVLESYPGQASAAKVDVHEDPRPDGARSTRSEAVQKALESLGAESLAPVVLDADYEKDRGIWTVKLLDDRRNPVTAEVADEA